MALWAANYRVYGARKLWLAARRAGHEIGRDQVAALMRAAGICGVTRRRRARTTVRDPGAERPGDLVNRDFTARSPNRLWVTDLTVAPTRTGAAYVCFIVDAFSRLIVGWRVAAHMRTEMVLDAVEMARRGRGARIEGLTVHSDAGSQFTSVRYSERLAELGAAPSVGSVGDSYDNALAETVIGLYKSELIRGPRQGPWDSAADVELATLGWVHWHNHQRLHTYLGDVPPDELRSRSLTTASTGSPESLPDGWKPINAAPSPRRISDAEQGRGRVRGGTMDAEVSTITAMAGTGLVIAGRQRPGVLRPPVVRGRPRGALPTCKS